MYSLTLKSTAQKELEKINEPFLSSISKAIDELTINPRNEKVKKLVGKPNQYRLKVGNYRILFFISDNDKTISIARVLHRKDAYKFLFLI